MRKFFKNKVLYILSATAIITGCLFVLFKGGPEVKAAESYNLYVANVEITSDNLVINSSDTSSVKSGSATFDPETTTLTLNGFTYEGDGYIYDNGYSIKSYGAIYYYNENKAINLTVKLVGTNKITSTFITDNASPKDKNSEHFMYIRGTWNKQSTLTIDGSGSLTCRYKTAGTGQYSIGLECSNIVINGGTIDVSTLFGDDNNYAIKCTRFTMNGGTLSAACDTQRVRGRCIEADTDITINGGTITATAPNVDQCSGLRADDNVIINGGEVTAIGQFPISGVIKNKMSGTSWTDLAGTKKPRTIEANINKDLSNLGYRRMYFVKVTDPVTISTGTGIKSVYLSTSQNATTGSASGTEFDSGSTVYGFAELAKGYKSKGWTLVSGTADTEGAKYRIGSVSAGSNNFGTISADLISYTIGYTLNGGSVSGNPTSYDVTTDTFTISNPTRDGFIFDGWSGTDLTEKTTSLNITKGSIGNRTYTANWVYCDEIQAVVDKINAIGTVEYTATCKEKIEAAESAYNGLSQPYKNIISTEYVTLVDAKTTYNGLKNTAVEGLISDINSITEVTYPSSKAAIVSAETAYDSILDSDKSLITNYANLTAARNSYDELRAAAILDVKNKIDNIAIPLVYPTSAEEISAARAAYEALDDSDKNETIITNYQDLLDIEAVYQVVTELNAITTVEDNDDFRNAVSSVRTNYNNLSNTQKTLFPETAATVLENYEAAIAVMDKINDIDTVAYTAASKTLIDTARNAYDALDNAQKALVMNYQKLTDAETLYNNVDAVVAKIDAIGTVAYTTDCKNKIDAARSAYNALGDTEKSIFPAAKLKTLMDDENAYMAMDAINEIGTVVNTEVCKKAIEDARAVYDAIPATAKSLVLNYETLTDDEAVFAVIDLVNAINYENTADCLTRIQTARTAYNALTDAQKDIFPIELTLKNFEAGFAVMQKIDAIGTIANTAESRAKVTTARAAYDDLEDDQEALVLNYQTLLDAEASFAKIDNVQNLIKAIDPLKYPDSEDALDAARDAYNALTPFEQGLVSNIADLEAKELAFNNADAVVDKINAIGKVKYPDSQAAIKDARDAYNALTDEEKDLVGYNNLATLAIAEGYFCSLEDNAKADEVIEKINEIAPLEITDACKGKIDAARAAYELLTEDQKAIVDNYEVLTKAETDYAAAKPVVDLINAIGDLEAGDACDAKISEARTAYDALEADNQKALVNNYNELTDKEAAKPVVDQIAEITAVEPTAECQALIDDAREAFDDLTEDQQALVTNKDRLFNAEDAKEVADLIEAIKPVVAGEDCQDAIDEAKEALEELNDAAKALVANKADLTNIEAAKPVVDLIDEIGDIEATAECQNAINAAREAYNQLTEAQQGLVSNIADLEAAEAAKAALDKINAIGEVTYPGSKDAIDAAREAYNGLDDTEKALLPEGTLKTLEDAEKAYKDLDDEADAENAKNLINAIGEVTYPGSKDAIDAARDAYDDLSKEAKDLIPADTLKALTDAEKMYDDVDNAVKAIDAIGEVKYPDSKDAIDAARDAYDGLTDAEKALVPAAELDALDDAEDTYQDLLDHAYADAATDLINAIGKVKYPDSKDAIDAARDAYDALTDAQKTIVGYDNYSKLVQAEGNLEAQKDLYFANKVKNLIKAIAPLEISDACKARIDAAREAYDDEEFTDEQRALVTNYADLVKAEADYAAAKEVVDLINELPEKVIEARKAYDLLTDEQKALVYNYDDLLLAEASLVDTLIDAIGNVEYTDECKEKIDEARAEYNALTDDQKAKVTKLVDLEDAEEAFADLRDDAIEAAIDAIDAIGNVEYTEECEELINAAREAYNAVLDDDKSAVTNADDLTDAEEEYAELVENHEAAEEVEALIDAIGDVEYTDDCKAAIEEAREAYDDLTVDQKALVENYDDLTDAEALIGAVDAVAELIEAIPSPLVLDQDTVDALDTARDAYDALTDDAKAIVPDDMLADLENNEAAFDVMELIDDIKPFALDDDCKERIDAAQEAYDKLTEDQKALVVNAEELEDAEDEYNEFIDETKASEVDALIDAIGTVAYTTDCKTKIDDARAAYDKLTDTQQGLVTKLQALQNAEASYKAVDDFVKAVDAIGTVELTDACKTKINTAGSLYLELGENKGLVPATTKKTFDDAFGAYNVMEKIAAIGTVAYTNECKTKISDAADFYDTLSDEAKALVTNKQTLLDAINIYKAVNNVVTKINAIPSPLVIDNDCESAIAQARSLYDALGEKQALVPEDMLATLVNNEKAYAVMQNIALIGTVELTDACKKKIDEASTAYGKLTEAQQALVANKSTLDQAIADYNALLDQAKADEVIAKINAIGEVAYPGSKDKIDAARAAYEALTATQKDLVTNLQTLEAAEAAYAKLKADNEAAKVAIDKIDAIGTVEYTEDCKKLINDARTEYDKLTADQKDLVTNYATLTAAETAFNTAQNNAINSVIGLIDAIKDFAYNSAYEDDLYDARDAYDDLLLSDQSSVTNYQTLVDAETLFNDIEDVIDLINAIPSPLVIDLDTDDAISDAREAYDELGNNMIYVPSKYTNLLESSEAAYDVMELIDLIPDEIDINDDDCVNAIFDAKDAYDALEPSIQALVANSAELEDAIEKYNDLNDKAAAALVDSLIDEIGEVEYTDVCKAKIDIARNAYNNLENNEQKALVTKLQVLEAAEAAYADLEAANVVIDKIDAIGTLELTDAKKTLIDDAKNAYEALTNTQKALVTNIADLNKAITDYDNAKNVKAKIDAIGNVTYTDASKAKIEDAREAYEALTEDQKTLVGMSELEILVNAEEKYEVLVVIDLIGKIGQVKYPTSEAAIKAARAAYDTLTADQKASITNTNVLTQAEATYAELKTNNEAAASVDALINAIGTVAYTTDCKNKIEAAIKAYNGLTPAQQALVKGVDTLDKADEKYEQLELDATRHSIVDTKSGVEIETKDGTGIPKTITLRVEVKTTVSAAEGSTAYAKITAMLEGREEIKGVYDVKLIQTINGVEKVVQPSEIKAGTKIKIHITIPEGIDGNEARILHIHSENDMEYVKDVQVIGNEFVFEVDRLSEFAIITPASGLPNWAIASIIGGGIVLVIVIGCLVVALVDRNKKKVEEE